MIKKLFVRLFPLRTFQDFVRGIWGFKSLDVLKMRGLEVGDNLLLMNGVMIDPSHCWLISIGNNVVLSPFVHILAHDTSTKMYCGYTKIGLVRIGNSVFIGANTVVLPGVTIGDNTIIGAGSVVTHSIPSNSVAVGNPCRVIGTIEEYKSRLTKDVLNSPQFDESYTVRNNVTNTKKADMVNALTGRNGYVK